MSIFYDNPNAFNGSAQNPFTGWYIKVGDEWIGEFSGTKVKLLYSGPVGEYPGWK